MEKIQRKDRICVAPTNLMLIATIYMSIIGIPLFTHQGIHWLFSCIIFVPFLIYSIYLPFSRKLFTGPRGIVIYRLLKPTVRIRYGQITKIEVSFLMRSTSLRFFKGQECMGGFYSSDADFDKLLSLLTQIMPERITYIKD